jgi:hypothetical protein
MADRKISQATERATIDGTEQFPISFGGNPFKVLISTVKDWVITFFANKTELDKISEYSGAMYYDGLQVSYPYVGLTDSATIEIDATTETNCILNTEETDISFDVINAVSGQFGIVVINNSETLNITLPVSRNNGTFTALPSACYLMCWTYDGTLFYFNIKQYAAIFSS